MTAPAFEALAALQDRDNEIARLRHRRSHLEERAALARVEADMAARAQRLDAARGRQREVVATQSEREQTLASTEARIAEIDKRMYSGTVSASRELQAMADEVAHLKGRVSELEEQVLEVMEAREPIDAEVAGIEGEQQAAADEVDRLRAAAVSAEAEIDAELAAEGAARADAQASVPAGLVKEYDQLRAKLDGVGAARLVGNQCTGCHLTLPATEVDRIHHLPDDEVVYCDNCGRILIR
jgi:predicted  nucleic acid-binding Zn-ribbon protein